MNAKSTTYAILMKFTTKIFLNRIADKGVKSFPSSLPRPLPTSFATVISTDVGISTKNFLTVTLTLLLSWYKVIPSASPKLLNLNQDHSSKKAVFLVKSL